MFKSLTVKCKECTGLHRCCAGWGPGCTSTPGSTVMSLRRTFLAQSPPVWRTLWDGFPSPVRPNSHLSVLVLACFYSNEPLIQPVIWKLLEFLFCPGTLEDWRFKHLLPGQAKQSYCFMGPVGSSFPRGNEMRGGLRFSQTEKTEHKASLGQEVTGMSGAHAAES